MLISPKWAGSNRSAISLYQSYRPRYLLSTRNKFYVLEDIFEVSFFVIPNTIKNKYIFKIQFLGKTAGILGFEYLKF